MTQQHWVTRRKIGRGFQYFDATGQITDKKQLAYFASLHVPPAWRDARIALSKRARILAVGFDKAGRKQYIYHPSFRARQEQVKFERTLRFARALPHMRTVTEEHLKHPQLDREKVLACIVRLMDEACFRVGNDTYARENQSYGTTTIRSKHTTVQGSNIVFDFVGKSGQHQLKTITDKRLAKIVKQLDELPGHEVFKYYDYDGNLADVKSADVNAYIKEIMGEEFSAKDFRTWGGTLLAAAELARAEHLESERERKKTVTQCVKKVARKLGNTPAVARGSYIDPRLIATFMEKGELHELQQTMEVNQQKASLKPDEQCVLKVLEQVAAKA